jgi:apolipoprotein D and lipocalin family protein
MTSLPAAARPLLALGLLAPLALALGGCASTPRPSTVAHVDLDRYLGRWYVISHVPYFLERGKVASYDTYARRPDGRLTNDFTFRKKTVDGPEKTWRGVAWVTDTETNATWKVQFVWPFAVTYKIFALDPAYTWAVVGTDDAGLLWLLARERQLDPVQEAEAHAALRAKGIDPSRLVAVPQPLE